MGCPQFPPNDSKATNQSKPALFNYKNNNNSGPQHRNNQTITQSLTIAATTNQSKPALFNNENKERRTQPMKATTGCCALRTTRRSVNNQPITNQPPRT